MSIKQPIYHEFDLNTTSGNSRVISLTHTDDAHVDVIELCVKQQGAPVDITGATVIARMVLHSTTDVLLNDNVPCTINDAGNILIPFDNAAVQTRKGIVKIEVNITRNPDILTLQLPLWVKINGSILDDATVDPHSEGTIPELLKDAADALEEATQALEDAKDYDKLENKPQINSHTLSGNKSSDDLGLQKKLTAGQNITIENDGTISASGGVTSYEDLSNKPKYNINYDGTFINKNIIGIIKFLQPFFQDENGITLKNITNQSLQDYTQYFYGFYSRAVTYNFGTTLSHVFVRCGCFSTTVNFCSNIPSAFSPYLPSNDLFYIIHLFTTHGAYNSQLARLVIFEDNISHKIRVFAQLIGCELSNPEATITAITDWQELTGGSQIVSGLVNQNGTITFTDSDGNTFTTTGASVIGADGFSPVATVMQTQSGATVTITDKNGTTTANISNGADGQDYVLTPQDKSDIADIVLSELPNADTMSF